jgi:hypothetical protein
MGAHEPPFQQGDSAMSPRQESQGCLPTRAGHPRPMAIPMFSKSLLSCPPGRDDHRAWGYCPPHEANHALLRGIGDLWPVRQIPPPLTSASHNHQGVGPHVRCPTPFLDATPKGLIHRHCSCQPISARAALVYRNLCKHVQCFIAAQPQSAHTALLVCDPPDRSEPCSQGEDGARGRSPRLSPIRPPCRHDTAGGRHPSPTLTNSHSASNKTHWTTATGPDRASPRSPCGSAPQTAGDFGGNPQQQTHRPTHQVE